MPIPVLTTKRLVLAPCEPADLDKLWAIWSEPEVREFLFDNRAPKREEAAAILGEAAGHNTDGMGFWTIRDAAEEIIGCIGLTPVGAAVKFDPDLAGCVEPIIAITQTRWGQGLAAEAMLAILDYAAATLAGRHLVALTDVPNVRSDRMLRQTGFVPRRECDGPMYRMRIYDLKQPARSVLP